MEGTNNQSAFIYCFIPGLPPWTTLVVECARKVRIQKSVQRVKISSTPAKNSSESSCLAFRGGKSTNEGTESLANNTYGTEVIDELTTEVFTRNGERSAAGVRLWYQLVN